MWHSRARLCHIALGAKFLAGFSIFDPMLLGGRIRTRVENAYDHSEET
jgi:hypothetical protein